MSGGGGGLRRVVRPQTQYKALTSEQEEERSRLLSRMGAFYVDACGRLGVRGRVVTLARLFDAGLCFGLLDPVSNILVNTLATTDVRPDDGTNTKAAAPLPLPSLQDKLPELGRRSLDGLSAFLLHFFPYLAAWEAVRYLLRADADLLVAARLVVADRGAGEEQRQHPRYHQGRSSCYLSSTNLPGLCSAIRKVEQQTPCTSTQEAYEAAAVAAWHPNPEAQALFLSSVQTVLEESVLSMLQGRDSLTSEDDPILFAGLSTAKIRMMPYLFLLAPSAGKCPILFFAEFGNKDDDDVPLMCCHVDAPTPFAEHVRCLYCEAQGARIVHPSLEKFCGGEEFGEVIQGERYFTNDRLICKSEYFVQSLGGNEEDFILEVFFHNPSSHNALFIKAISQVPTSPIQAELIALQMAMEAVAFIHCTEVAFLTDNFQLADAIQKGDFLQDPPF
uniref:RNase H type-1 domain-containing protein n=1 Tax=Oryza glumipatula TaxID=40148 RepID=A0A0E0B781_9ORYZ